MRLNGKKSGINHLEYLRIRIAYDEIATETRSKDKYTKIKQCSTDKNTTKYTLNHQEYRYSNEIFYSFSTFDGNNKETFFISLALSVSFAFRAIKMGSKL